MMSIFHLVFALIIGLTVVTSQQTSTGTTAVVSDCNICGDGYMIMNPTGVVAFNYTNQGVLKNSCNEWQDIVQNPNAISIEFCKTEIVNYTMGPCKCTSIESGELLSDVIKQQQQQAQNGGSGSNSTNSSTNGSDSSTKDKGNSAAAPVSLLQSITMLLTTTLVTVFLYFVSV